MPAELIYSYSEKPEISIIIPSLDGCRDGNVNKLVTQLKDQTFKNIEIIIAKNEYPNGHARNVGVNIARGSIYMFFDDDVTLGHDSVINNFVNSIKNNKKIGLIGSSQLSPADSTCMQKWLAYDLNRGSFPIQKATIESDMATHAGMACRASVWQEMGGESDTLVTGTDTDLRERMRSVGYKVMVAADTWVYHPLPRTVTAVFKSAIFHGKHQLDYRELHGFQKGFLAPFRRISNKKDLICAYMRELLLLFPHILISNKRPTVGFRPINALFRLLMVLSYSNCAYHELGESRHV